MSELLSAEHFRDTRKPLAEASGLPRHLYLDPAVFALERERIFKREWLFVGHVSSLRNAHDYFTLNLIDHPLVVVRGEDGVVRTFHNVCRHRGMAVASGAGNSRSFACPYHAWTYDTSGCLVAAPEMDGVECFDPAATPLLPVATEVVQGMIFVNLAGNATSLAASLPDLIGLLAPWNIADMEPAYVSEIEGEFNWKTMLENANEAYHVMGTHRDSYNGIAPAELSYSTDCSGRAWMDLYTPYADPAAMPTGPVIPGLPAWAGERLSFFALHPNFLISIMADSVVIYRTSMDGPQRTRFIATVYVPRSTLEWEGFADHLAGVGPWVDQVNQEDLVACEGVNRGMKSDGWRPGRYSPLEKPIWQFHNWYLERMLGEQG